jgi:hypothetical protein
MAALTARAVFKVEDVTAELTLEELHLGPTFTLLKMVANAHAPEEFLDLTENGNLPVINRTVSGSRRAEVGQRGKGTSLQAPSLIVSPLL